LRRIFLLTIYCAGGVGVSVGGGVVSSSFGCEPPRFSTSLTA